MNEPIGASVADAGPPAIEVPSTLNVAVEYADAAIAAGHGNRTAYLYEGERLTFSDVLKRVNQVGNALAALGVDIEQRVAVLLPNRPEFVTSFFGAIKIGAVPTAMSFASRRRSILRCWPTAAPARSSPRRHCGGHCATAAGNCRTCAMSSSLAAATCGPMSMISLPSWRGRPRAWMPRALTQH
jgi:hypothetical protein